MSLVPVEQAQYQKICQIKEININQALGFSGDGKKSVLWNMQIYLEQAKTSAEKLDSLEKQNQIKDYTTLVHAIKSNLALIGAETL